MLSTGTSCPNCAFQAGFQNCNERLHHAGSPWPGRLGLYEILSGLGAVDGGDVRGQQFRAGIARADPDRAKTPPTAPTQSGTPTTLQIQVVLNWFEQLKQRVPVR